MNDTLVTSLGMKTPRHRGSAAILTIKMSESITLLAGISQTDRLPSVKPYDGRGAHPGLQIIEHQYDLTRGRTRYVVYRKTMLQRDLNERC